MASQKKEEHVDSDEETQALNEQIGLIKLKMLEKQARFSKERALKNTQRDQQNNTHANLLCAVKESQKAAQLNKISVENISTAQSNLLERINALERGMPPRAPTRPN